MHLCSAVLGLLLPAYNTFKQLKAGKRDNYDLVLRKWVVLAMFASVCYLGDLFVPWLPFYQDLKIAALLAITLVREEFVLIGYERLISPWLSRNEKKIDALLDGAVGIYKTKSRELIRWAQAKAVAYMSERNKSAPKRPATTTASRSRKASDEGSKH